MQKIDSLSYEYAQEGCYICHTGTGPFIDLDAVVEGEGALAICRGCLLDAARALGLEMTAYRQGELDERELQLHSMTQERDAILAEMDANSQARYTAEQKLTDFMAALAEGMDRLSPREPASQLFKESARENARKVKAAG